MVTPSGQNSVNVTKTSDGKMGLPEPETSQPIASLKGQLLEASFSIAH